MAKKASTETGKQAGTVNLPEIEQILEFMGKHGLEEFEYERAGLHIRLKKPSATGGYRAMPAPEMYVAAPPRQRTQLAHRRRGPQPSEIQLLRQLPARPLARKTCTS